MVGDYRRLNGATIADRYPIPHIHDFCVFSKIDLVRGYHQIVVAKENIQKSAVIAPLGLFKVVKAEEKTFDVERGNRTKTGSNQLTSTSINPCRWRCHGPGAVRGNNRLQRQ